ncbi:MAG: ATP-dependent DNA helicase RecG, partial [Dehalococcoidia bacterium]|nr:ATP-dependent DNA helicase RecG [Dehalococcoidia bacterium]
PEYEVLESDDLVHTGRLIPIYPLTEGLGARTVRRLVKDAVDHWSNKAPDFMPPDVAKRNRLMPLTTAIQQIHYPDTEECKEQARRRLAFDELLLLQLSVMAKRRDWQGDQPGHPMTSEGGRLDRFLSSLPFSLTTAQQRVLREILADMAGARPMSRLLQGEVGSGKTVIAAAAAVVAVSCGFQAAIMAPTEILAEQHFRSISALLARVAKPKPEEELVHTYSSFLDRPISVALLTGSVRKSDKNALQQRIQRGEIDIIIGTHALLQEGVEFQRLGLAIVDEQHRFGVLQRSALRQKGFNPHLLVMTATPIPRTLALTLYGDLELSVIDQLPPGRQSIKTKWVGPDKRERAYEFLREQVQSGRQAFIICPLIEESEAIEARAAVAEYERLATQVFRDLRLGLLHGRMTPSEKDATMRRFRDGELDILVSTAVVEVGIDVPNATVMMVEGADRFGLSQLHQFRGRVGRGVHKSYCLLLSDALSADVRERLTILERTDDGFKLAEEDLKLRGPGEFFGTRQSGLPDLRLARLSDIELMEMAHREAVALSEADPWLKKPAHRLLAQEVSRAGVKGEGDLS